MAAKRPVNKLPWNVENIKDEEAKAALKVLEQQYRLLVLVQEEFESRITTLEP